MLELMVRGTSIGFSAGMTPGPLQAYLLSTTLNLGWKRSLPIVLSPLITDIPIIFVCVFLLGALPPLFITAIQLIGGLFVLWLAWGSYQSWRKGETISASEDDTKPATNPLPRAMMMNLLSPGPYIFWTLINGPLLVQALNTSALHAVAFMFSFYGTFLALLAAMVIIFARVGSLNPTITRRLVLFSAVVMALFGLSLLWQAVSGLFVVAA
jgi:threonine/homoserine/homoserine lactone efflux protein